MWILHRNNNNTIIIIIIVIIFLVDCWLFISLCQAFIWA